MSESTVTGWCERGDCSRCNFTLRAGTGWNWWCTHDCHPEPTVTNPDHQPALDFWRRHRKAGVR